MFSPQRKLICLSAVFGVLFIAGMVQLFLLRFETGDVYPVYSTLRTDPLGTRAFYESLERLSPESVQRNFRPLKQTELGVDTTLMIIGINQKWVFWRPEQYDDVLNRLAQTGGRLVMTFKPDSILGSEERKQEETEQGREEEIVADKKGAVDEAAPSEETAGGACNEEEERDFDSGLLTLGFSFHEPDEEGGEDFAERFWGRADILPRTIPWRALLTFNLRDNSWETIYTWQGQPVVVQRPWGKGTVVMVADSYLLSNEALRNHRFSGLLTWLVRPGNKIIFDESLKGLIKQPGIAGLTRQYRLHGVIAAVLVVVALFVWRQAAVFIAPVQSEKSSPRIRPAAGKDSRQGLVHLARRHVDIKMLLPLCFETWQGRAAQNVPASRIAEVEVMVNQAAADPRSETQVTTYIEICELLKQGKRS